MIINKKKELLIIKDNLKQLIEKIGITEVNRLVYDILSKKDDLRIYKFLIEGQNLQNYRSNEFLIIDLIKAIKQIGNIKIINIDVFNLIILMGNEDEILLLLEILSSLNDIDFIYIKNETTILERLKSKGLNEKIKKLEEHFLKETNK